MESLIEGFNHFQQSVFPAQRAAYERAAKAQTPHTMIITCSDSRILLERIFCCELGELFVYRNVGNIVPPYGQQVTGEAAAIEYAVSALKVRHIVICGHSDCGAMKALAHPHELEDKPSTAAWLKHAETARHIVAHRKHSADPNAQSHELSHLIEENVMAQLDHLRTMPIVAARLVSGDLQIHGWIYDIAKAELRSFDPAARMFSLIEPSQPYGPRREGALAAS
ncbi:Carbonic anhydrase 1 [Methylocella tundrae]|jgi:carbonic anhydrase|uniref:Carbonic anhydrase n=1 Tax=Methylocella tundrae TaxID=227605 RepID=A0A8B6M8V8_METTU|nr:carbonic anhydrase [Methylocella tundrae]VTZ25092.1 Carbonic anhydrase 1 [Methylocella tundrae]VTZ51340.1 Carbonic anhydrase 1 [Methylocella tundrae]